MLSGGGPDHCVEGEYGSVRSSVGPGLMDHGPVPEGQPKKGWASTCGGAGTSARVCVGSKSPKEKGWRSGATLA